MGERGQLAGRVFGNVEVTMGVSTAGLGGDISLVVGRATPATGTTRGLALGAAPPRPARAVTWW